MLGLTLAKRIGPIIASAWMLLAPSAEAGTPVVYKDGNSPVFSIEVPDFWSLRTGGLREISNPETGDLRDISRVFGFTPKGHDGIWVGAISPHGVSTLDAAQAYLRDIGPFLVTDAKVDTPRMLNVNGRAALSLTGQGRRAGTRVDFTVLSIDLAGPRVVIAIVILEAGADTEPLGDINEMLSSIKLAR